VIALAWTGYSVVAISAHAPSGTTDTVHPGSWTALWLSTVMTGIGVILAFDVRGIATTLYKNNTEFTPWGRRLHTSTWPNPARFVGWCFLIPGSILLTLTIIVGAVHLLRHI